MDTHSTGESTRPMGVIGCLTAGFEVLSRNVGLLGLPVSFDILLWLGPRLSVEPVARSVISFLRSYAPQDPEAASQIALSVQLLEQFAERFNLVSLLGLFPLLSSPSLLAGAGRGGVSPLGDAHVIRVGSTLGLIGWAMLLVPIGIMVGFLYLNSVARRVHALGTGLGDGVLESTRGGVLGRFGRTVLFAGALLVGGTTFGVFWMILVGLTSSFAQPLALLVWLVGLGLGSYLALHLMFVMQGVLLGERGLLRSLWESVLMIRMQFLPVIGLLLAVMLIRQGLDLVWSLPSEDSWSLLVGILGHACVATGLTAGTFVFYRERVGQLPNTARRTVGN